MKKVIGGRLYNTETAKSLGVWSNEMSYRDFQWCREELFLTKSGAYFLHGEGGAMSRYSKSTGDGSWSGGESIIPMSPEVAMEWAEKHLSADEYADAFGEPEEAEEAEGRIARTFILSKGAVNNLERIRRETGKNLSDIVDELILGA